MFITSVPLPAMAQHALPGATRHFYPEAADIEAIEIPPDLGWKTGRWSPDGGPPQARVVLVQDIHAHPEAQQNISGILAHLHTRYGFGTFFVEGATEPCLPEIYAALPDPVSTQSLSRFLIEEGIFSGADDFAVRHADAVILMGAEDAEAYRKHLAVYRRVVELQGNVLVSARELGRLFESLSKERLPEVVQRLQESESLFNAGKIPHDLYFKELLSLAADALIDTREYEHLSAYAQVAALGEKIDPEVVREEAVVLLKGLARSPVREVRVAVGRLQRDAAEGRLSSGEYFVRLSAIGELERRELIRRGADFPGSSSAHARRPESWKHLGLYVRYLDQHDRIDAMKLPGEAQALTSTVIEAYLTTQDERVIYRWFSRWKIVESLLQLSLTPEEYRTFLSFWPELTPERLARALEPLISDWSAVHDTLTVLLESVPEFEAFYAWAVLRDDFLVKNVLTHMRQQQVPEAVLVAGGFHSPGVGALLREQGVAYAVVTPRADTQPDPRMYKERLNGRLPPILSLIQKSEAYALSAVPGTAPEMIPVAVPTMLGHKVRMLSSQWSSLKTDIDVWYQTFAGHLSGRLSIRTAPYALLIDVSGETPMRITPDGTVVQGERTLSTNVSNGKEQGWIDELKELLKRMPERVIRGVVTGVGSALLLDMLPGVLPPGMAPILAAGTSLLLTTILPLAARSALAALGLGRANAGRAADWLPLVLVAVAATMLTGGDFEIVFQAAEQITSSRFLSLSGLVLSVNTFMLSPLISRRLVRVFSQRFNVSEGRVHTFRDRFFTAALGMGMAILTAWVLQDSAERIVHSFHMTPGTGPVNPMGPPEGGEPQLMESFDIMQRDEDYSVGTGQREPPYAGRLDARSQNPPASSSFTLSDSEPKEPDMSRTFRMRPQATYEPSLDFDETPMDAFAPDVATYSPRVRVVSIPEDAEAGYVFSGYALINETTVGGMPVIEVVDRHHRYWFEIRDYGEGGQVFLAVQDRSYALDAAGELHGATEWFALEGVEAFGDDVDFRSIAAQFETQLDQSGKSLDDFIADMQPQDAAPIYVPESASLRLVEPGDSMWKIAEEALGAQGLDAISVEQAVDAIVQVNRVRNPDFYNRPLWTGDAVIVPNNLFEVVQALSPESLEKSAYLERFKIPSIAAEVAVSPSGEDLPAAEALQEPLESVELAEDASESVTDASGRQTPGSEEGGHAIYLPAISNFSGSPVSVATAAPSPTPIMTPTPSPTSFAQTFANQMRKDLSEPVSLAAFTFSMYNLVVIFLWGKVIKQWVRYGAGVPILAAVERVLPPSSLGESVGTLRRRLGAENLSGGISAESFIRFTIAKAAEKDLLLKKYAKDYLGMLQLLVYGKGATDIVKYLFVAYIYYAAAADPAFYAVWGPKVPFIILFGGGLFFRTWAMAFFWFRSLVVVALERLSPLFSRDTGVTAHPISRGTKAVMLAGFASLFVVNWFLFQGGMSFESAFFVVIADLIVISFLTQPLGTLTVGMAILINFIPEAGFVLAIPGQLLMRILWPKNGNGDHGGANKAENSSHGVESVGLRARVKETARTFLRDLELLARLRIVWMIRDRVDATLRRSELDDDQRRLLRENTFYIAWLVDEFQRNNPVFTEARTPRLRQLLLMPVGFVFSLFDGLLGKIFDVLDILQKLGRLSWMKTGLLSLLVVSLVSAWSPLSSIQTVLYAMWFLTVSVSRLLPQNVRFGKPSLQKLLARRIGYQAGIWVFSIWTGFAIALVFAYGWQPWIGYSWAGMLIFFGLSLLSVVMDRKDRSYMRIRDVSYVESDYAYFAGKLDIKKLPHLIIDSRARIDRLRFRIKEGAYNVNGGAERIFILDSSALAQAMRNGRNFGDSDQYIRPLFESTEPNDPFPDYPMPVDADGSRDTNNAIRLPELIGSYLTAQSSS